MHISNKKNNKNNITNSKNNNNKNKHLFKGYIELIRPFTLLAPFFVSLCIMIAGLIFNVRVNQMAMPADWILTALRGAITMALVNAASNSLNQAADIESDIISKPYRPIPKKLIKLEEANSFAYSFYLIAMLLAFTINWYFTLITFLIMMFTVTYSLPPRMKQYLFINQIWIAIPRGLLGILAGWSVFSNPFQVLPLAMGSIAMIFLIGGMSTKDIVDSEADKITGVNTLVNTFGVRRAAYISVPFMVAPYIFIPLLIQFKLIHNYFWPLTLFGFFSLFVYVLMKQSHQKAKKFENIQAWSMMYVEYILFAITFASLAIFGGYFS